MAGPHQTRRFHGRVFASLERTILGVLMSLAAAVLERRIRKALRSEKGQADEREHPSTVL